MKVKVLRPRETLPCIFFTLESGMQFQVNSPKLYQHSIYKFQNKHIESALVKNISLSVSLSMQLEMSMLTLCGNRKELATADYYKCCSG